MNFKDVWKSIQETKGASFNLHTGELNPPQGYMVPVEGHSEDYPVPENFDEFRKRCIDYLYERKKVEELAFGSNRVFNYLGLWIEKDRMYLDISRIYYNREEAIKLGKARKQLAIWDNEKKENIYL